MYCERGDFLKAMGECCLGHWEYLLESEQYFEVLELSSYLVELCSKRSLSEKEKLRGNVKEPSFAFQAGVWGGVVHCKLGSGAFQSY